MSKDELQVNFRMPAALKAELEAAAKQNGRSLTAEVVARLDLSVFAETRGGEDILPAHLAREYAATARVSLPAVVRDRIRRAINGAVVRGLAGTRVPLEDLKLEALPAEDLARIQFEISYELRAAGYGFEWDGGDSVWVAYDNTVAVEEPPIEVQLPKADVKAFSGARSKTKKA